MRQKSPLGEFEHVVLLAILQLEDRAYGPDISNLLEKRAKRAVSRGALYATLDRLERKGLVRWKVEAPTAARGGHPKRRFELTANGMHAVRATRRTLLTLWEGLEEVL